MQPFTNSNPAISVPFRSGHDDSSWLSERFGRPMSPFEQTVGEILSAAFGGMHHIEREALSDTALWSPSHCLLYTGKDLATYDSDILTFLVIACHDAAVRFSVDPATHNQLILSFWPRAHNPDKPSRFARHATLDSAIASVRSNYVPVLTARLTT